MNSQDFLLDPTTGDIMIKNGDFVIGASDEQHIVDTINAFPGWWKQFPADGVGIKAYQNSSGQEQKLAGAIKQQLQNDNYNLSIPTVNIAASKISIGVVVNGRNLLIESNG